MCCNKNRYRIVIALIIFITTNLSIAASSPKVVPSLYVVEKMNIDYHLNADATSVETIEQQILIKDQLMVDALSTEEVTFNNNQEKVEILEAYTILSSGEKIIVETKAIRLVDVDTDATSSKFSEEKKYTIIFPHVTPGARTYYKSRTVRHTPILPGLFVMRLAFSPQIEYSGVDISFTHDSAIKVFKSERSISGGRVPDGPKGEIRYRYNYAQSQVVGKEPAQVSYTDYAPSLTFSTFETPIEFGHLLEKLYKPKLKVTPKVQQLAEEITAGMTDQKEQARAIYNWVNKNIRYIALFLGDGGLVPHDAESILNNRYGDCKDHNVLLIAMLAVKGIHAITAPVNLGSKYASPVLGTIGPFNHEITYIPQWDLYLDSTQELLPFGVLPGDVSDKPTLLAALGKMGRTPNSSADKNRTVTYAKLKIEKDGQTRGETKTEYFGENEYAARIRFSGYKGQGKEKMVRTHLNNFNEVGTGSFQPSDVYSLDTPFNVKSEFDISSISNFPGPGAMTVPMGLAPGTLTFRGYSNTDFYASRPFICSSYTYEEHYELDFDSEIKISRIPKGMNYRVADASSEIRYESSYIKAGQIIRVSRILRTQQSGRVCDPEKMAEIQAMYKVIRKDILSQIFYE